MKESPPQSTSILKALLVIMPMVFLILIIWIAYVYIGNVYFDSKAPAGQYLLWLVSGILIFIIYPLVSKISLSKWTAGKNAWYVITAKTELKKADWVLFVCLHLIGMTVLFWLFSDIQTHINIQIYFVEHFGRGSRGQPNFPIMLLFMFVPVGVLASLYHVALKVKYGTFNEPKFEDSESNDNFRRKREVYFAFVLATSITVVFCYLCKMILLV